jgi:hypothetical protein
MSSGIKRSANRPKTAKHLRSQRKKKFKNENPDAMAAYREKMAKRTARRLKKKKR